MRRLLADIAKAAPTPATVLIVGPSGTGKELVARAIHDSSLVKAGPFVQVNCAAIPDTLIESELFGHERGSFTGADRKQTGKFVEADGGTIFLDEVGDMSAPAQAKVLRVLQEGEVEPVGSPRVVKVKVRVVAATNRDLTMLIAQGKFREDLYYRLNVLVLRTPPLGERREDVPVSRDVVRGAVREDEQLPAEAVHGRGARGARRASVAGERPRAEEPRRAPHDHVGRGRPRRRRRGRRGGRAVRSKPAPSPCGEAGSWTAASAGVWERLVGIGTLQEFQDETEKLFLVAKLAENGGNVTRTAEAIDTPRSNLYKKIDRYGLRRDREGGEP